MPIAHGLFEPGAWRTPECLVAATHAQRQLNPAELLPWILPLRLGLDPLAPQALSNKVSGLKDFETLKKQGSGILRCHYKGTWTPGP